MSLWDPQQREWLQAMGHSPLVLAGDEPTGGEAAERGAISPDRAALQDSAPTPPSSPAPSRTSAAHKAAALATARRAGAPRISGPLGEALVRATGQQPAGAARILRNLEVDQAALRDDPAAKRALWTRLRQLRKAARK